MKKRAIQARLQATGSIDQIRLRRGPDGLRTTLVMRGDGFNVCGELQGVNWRDVADECRKAMTEDDVRVAGFVAFDLVGAESGNSIILHGASIDTPKRTLSRISPVRVPSHEPALIVAKWSRRRFVKYAAAAGISLAAAYLGLRHGRTLANWEYTRPVMKSVKINPAFSVASYMADEMGPKGDR